MVPTLTYEQIIAFIYPCLLQYYSRIAWYDEFTDSKLLVDDVTRTPKIATTPINHVKHGLSSLHSNTPITHASRIYQSNIVLGIVFVSSIVSLITVFVLQVFVL